MTKTKAELFYDRISNLGCISKMAEDDKVLFKDIFLKVFNNVDAEPIIKEIHFTPHGKSHLHDIYEIVSNTFVNSYNESDDELSPKELLILNLAILFHDIGMHDTELGAHQREIHAQVAYDKAQDLLNELSTNAQIDQIGGSEVPKLIARICGAHSDANGGYRRLQISEVQLFNKESKRDIGSIRVLLLAVILRIADELDNCIERTNTTKENKTQNESRESLRESLNQHWQLCRLFHIPEYDSENNTVVLKMRAEGFYEKNCENTYSENFDLIIKYIKKLYGGADSKENETIENIFEGRRAELQINCTRLLSAYKEESKENSLIKRCATLRFALQQDNGKKECINWGKYYFKYIRSIRDKLASEIAIGKRGHVLEHKSLKYISGVSPCIYDHMNFHKLVDSGDMQTKIGEIIKNSFGKIIEEVGDVAQDNSIIIGIDSIGSRLAIMLGNEIKLPILPYASKSRQSVYPHIEISDDIADKWYKESIKDKKFVFIICDNIYTFDSISTCLNRLGLCENKIVKHTSEIYIFCLFDRRPINGDYFSDEIGRKPNYVEFQKSFKIYPIFDKMKTNFVRQDACMFCMLKQGVVK